MRYMSPKGNLSHKYLSKTLKNKLTLQPFLLVPNWQDLRHHHASLCRTYGQEYSKIFVE